MALQNAEGVVKTEELIRFWFHRRGEVEAGC
jgi:hypothetical protein